MSEVISLATESGINLGEGRESQFDLPAVLRILLDVVVLQVHRGQAGVHHQLLHLCPAADLVVVGPELLQVRHPLQS